MVELSALVLLLGLAAEPATAPAVETAPVGDSHERWEGATPVQGDDHVHGEGHDPAHDGDHAHGHGFHFDFDAVRMHHTMPYPAIEWFHGRPVVIFDLKKYAAKYLDELSHDKAFASAVATPYLGWAQGEVTLAKAMAVADGKALFSFPHALSFFNNQTFIGTIALLLLTFILFRARPKPGQVKPVGAVQHMLESVVLFIRDDIVRPNVKGPAAHGHGHDDHGHGHGAGETAATASYADRWVPHFAAIFLGILAFNLVGLIPGGGTASGNPGVTVAFAVTTLVTMLFFGFKEQGFFSFWVNLVPVHWSWKPMDMLVWFLLFVIELMGLLIKPAALAIRLAANMFAGHTALLAFTTLGFIIYAANSDQGALSLGLGAVGWVVAVALYFLELLVAFIQAYIFTLLSAIFIGTSIHPEH